MMSTKEAYKHIKTLKLLFFAILIGIVGSLIAGVINDLIRNTIVYPWLYLFFLGDIFLIGIWRVLKPLYDVKRGLENSA